MLDLPPKQWYPAGDPRNEEDETPVAPTIKLGETKEKETPTTQGSPVQRIPATQSEKEDGEIKNFSW